MNKTLILSLTLLITACATKLEEQKFVNPIFYKVMDPISRRGSWPTQITPTEMVRSNEGTVVNQNCTLEENTIEAVTLRCEAPYKKDYIILYRFILVPENKSYGGMLVRMQFRAPHEPEEFTSQMSFTID